MTEQRGAKKAISRDYFEALLIAMIFVNFARVFVFQAFKIPTGSMIDNLLIGDHIIVNKFAYGEGGPLAHRLLPLRRIERGDIVVFRYPEQPQTDFVKRVIGLPDETVTIRDKKVLIDGVPLEEPYVTHDDPEVFPAQPGLPARYRQRDQFGPYVVPRSSYFVMGDNRDRSNDSRFWGPVRRELIKGRAFMIYWSYGGTPPPPGAKPIDRLRELGSIAKNFFRDTRWERSFRVVDSRSEAAVAKGGR